MLRTLANHTSPSPAPSDSDLLTYLDRLDGCACRVGDLLDQTPLPIHLKSVLKQNWRVTRQKLSYFRRELQRSEGEVREDLKVLHHTLLPDVIHYQVTLGTMILDDNCSDKAHIQNWRALWTDYVLD